jgi:hypothetical protein
MTHAVTHDEENLRKAFSTDRDGSRAGTKRKQSHAVKEMEEDKSASPALLKLSHPCARTNITLLQSAPHPNLRPQPPCISQRHQ